ncbi:MAG: hypothetical protein NC311_14475 [Muribaculaceae bacterium]|nr:hypothetical protein [Muribaculaceae bacterium]
MTTQQRKLNELSDDVQKLQAEVQCRIKLGVKMYLNDNSEQAENYVLALEEAAYHLLEAKKSLDIARLT